MSLRLLHSCIAFKPTAHRAWGTCITRAHPCLRPSWLPQQTWAGDSQSKCQGQTAGTLNRHQPALISGTQAARALAKQEPAAEPHSPSQVSWTCQAAGRTSSSGVLASAIASGPSASLSSTGAASGPKLSSASCSQSAPSA